VQILPLKTRILKPNLELGKTLEDAFLTNKCELKEKDVLVLSSKVVALSEGRLVDLSTIKPSAKAIKLNRTFYGKGKEDPRVTELILREADKVFPGKMFLTLKGGVLIPSAGIDKSNVPDGFVILWPKDSWKSARTIRKQLCKKFKLKKLGVIICDSRCQPMRWGVIGVAISWAGIEGVEDARGTKDIFKKPLKVTKKAVADNLTSAALVVMGEAAEKVPFVLIKNAPVKFTNKQQSVKDIFIKPGECIFEGIYNKEVLKNNSK
jgi:coenzyme F420-0:L-glutamate ligase